MKNAQTTTNAKTLTAAEKRRAYYLKRQGELHDEAVEYFNSDECYSYGAIIWYTEYFEKMGRRYGLLTEFRENGVI